MKRIFAITFISLACIYALVIFIGPALMLHLLCDRHFYHGREFSAEEASLPPSDTLWLRTDDGLLIHTLEQKPTLLDTGGEQITAQQVKGVIICLSGIENPSVTYFYGHVRTFSQLGLVTLLPDMRGHGHSEGEQICLGFKEPADVKALTDYAKKEYPDVPVIVMGLSMGGAVAASSVGMNDDIDAIITLSAFSSIQDYIGYQLGRYITPLLAYPARWTSALYAGWKFGIDAFKTTPLEGVRHLSGRPALIMHSRYDTVVPYRSFELLSAEAMRSTSLLRTYVADGDEHFVTRSFGVPEEDDAYMSVIRLFLEEVIGLQK